MSNIIVAFPKVEDAKSIRNLLVRHGYDVKYVCTTGSQVLEAVDDFNGGIVISGYKFPDMLYRHLHEQLPPDFRMLLIASGKVAAGCYEKDITVITMPLKVQELLQVVENMDAQMSRLRRRRRQMPRRRDPQEQALIDEAKRILMEKKHFTEEEAHRYIQKTSMDSGTGKTETAQMIIRMMKDC